MARPCKGNYEITVKRGRWRTVWGARFTKDKANQILREMNEEPWKSRRLKSKSRGFSRPRIRKMKK